MSNTKTDIEVSVLVKHIEALLGWGSAGAWTNYDLDKLSELIKETTGITLSLSTLKRVFGKVSYQSTPSVTTLNTLSKFLGYEDWRDFISKQENEPAPAPIEVKNTKIKVRKNLVLFFIGVAVIMTGILAFKFLNNNRHYNPADFSFRSKTVLTEGLPNSVVFDYDASKANDEDSVFINQTWDKRRKVWVNKVDKHHSAIYYYPGYFRAKLLIGNDIIKEHDIQIRTDDG